MSEQALIDAMKAQARADMSAVYTRTEWYNGATIETKKPGAPGKPRIDPASIIAFIPAVRYAPASEIKARANEAGIKVAITTIRFILNDLHADGRIERITIPGTNARPYGYRRAPQ